MKTSYQTLRNLSSRDSFDLIRMGVYYGQDSAYSHSFHNSGKKLLATSHSRKRIGAGVPFVDGRIQLVR